MKQTARLDMEDFLAGLKNECQPLLYVANSGNAGDALIGHATFQLFDRLGLDYVSLADYKNIDPTDRVILCAGGGNLVPLYHGTDRVLEWAQGRARRVIVLPHTIRGNDELLAGLGPEVDLICREMLSFEAVSGAVNSAQVHLADDMAFLLDVHKTLSEEPPQPSQASLYARKLAYKLFRPSLKKTIPSPWKLKRSDQMMAARSAVTGQGQTVLDAYRNDVEKTEFVIPQGNLDVAQLFSHGTRNPFVCATGSYHMLRYLDTFDEVHTNRLHVCIGSALLGKRVKFAPNSYRKNEAVYDFSIRGQFPNVEWQGESGAG